MNPSNKTLTVIARARARPGQEAALENELRAVLGPTHKEPGCLKYALHRGAQDPRQFLIVERWESKEALDRHMTTPHVRKLMANIPGLLEGAPEIVAYEGLSHGSPEKGSL